MDTLCTPPLSKPHPKLLWLINEEPAPSEFTSIVNETSLRLHFPLQVHHLQSKQSKFSLKCIASFKFNQSLYETSFNKTSSLLLSNTTHKVIIYGLQSKFKLGDLLRLTCHYAGDDNVQMHWQVNYRRLPAISIIKYAKPQFIGMRLTLQPWHLDHLGRINVKCIAGKIFKNIQNNGENELIHSTTIHFILINLMMNLIFN